MVGIPKSEPLLIVPLQSWYTPDFVLGSEKLTSEMFPDGVNVSIYRMFHESYVAYRKHKYINYLGKAELPTNNTIDIL